MPRIDRMQDRKVATPPPPAASPWWAALVPLSVLLLSLIGLLVTAVVSDHRARIAWGEIAEIATPAHTHVNGLQTDLAREMAARRAFLLTGSPAFLDRMRAAQQREEAQLGSLGAVAPALGGDVAARLSDVRGLFAQWRSLGPISQSQARSAHALADATAREQQLFEETLLGVTQLQQSIDGFSRSRRDVIRQVDRTERQLTIALIVIAILAAALYLRFARQLRALADREAAAAALSERRRAELERVMADMKRLAEEKTRFIRGVTHDLKNPLSAIDAYAELLELGVRGPLSAPQLDTIARMRRSAGSMLGIIEDLLELSRAESGQLQVRPAPTELEPLLEEACGAQRAVAETRGLDLSLDVRAPLPPLRTDERRLRQVLDNLLSNALKYTPKGGRITLRASVAASGPDGAAGDWAVLTVEDTGPGIPPAEQERIFNEFYRLNSAQEGSGLGLAISRRIARLLGGDVTVESGPGGGSRFHFWLPLLPEHRLSSHAA